MERYGKMGEYIGATGDVVILLYRLYVRDEACEACEG